MEGLADLKGIEDGKADGFDGLEVNVGTVVIGASVLGVVGALVHFGAFVGTFVALYFGAVVGLLDGNDVGTNVELVEGISDAEKANIKKFRSSAGRISRLRAFILNRIMQQGWWKLKFYWSPPRVGYW